MCSDLFRLAFGTDWFYPADAASTVAIKTLLCACKGDIYHVFCTSEWIYTIRLWISSMTPLCQVCHWIQKRHRPNKKKCLCKCKVPVTVFISWDEFRAVKKNLSWWYENLFTPLSVTQDRVFSVSPTTDTFPPLYRKEINSVVESQPHRHSSWHLFLAGNKQKGKKLRETEWSAEGLPRCSSSELPPVATVKRWDGSFVTSERACPGKLTLLYEDKVSFE